MRMQSKGNLPPPLVGVKKLYSYYGIQYGISSEGWELIYLKSQLAIPHLDIYPKDALSNHKDTCTTVFIAALFIIARACKQPKCPSTEEWIKKMQYVYIYTMEYYLAVKRMKFTGK